MYNVYVFTMCLYVCVHLYVPMCTYVLYGYLCVCVSLCLCMYIGYHCMCVWVVCMCTCICACICLFVYWMCACVYMCVYVCVCMYTSVCVHKCLYRHACVHINFWEWDLCTTPMSHVRPKIFYVKPWPFIYLFISIVMRDTQCHIHFPDSNRTSSEKSNQVNILCLWKIWTFVF